jgi:hypothetical protein
MESSTVCVIEGARKPDPPTEYPPYSRYPDCPNMAGEQMLKCYNDCYYRTQ